MNWNSTGFQELEKTILLTANKNKSGLDVPFFRFRYKPELELHCISEFAALAKRLQAKDCSVELIWANELFLEALERIDSIDNLIKFEMLDRMSIYEDISNENKGLPQIIANIIAKRLDQKRISHSAIILRVGSLFPFVKISSLLTILETNVKCMIIIPYPEKSGEILNYKGESINNYNRGEVI